MRYKNYEGVTHEFFGMATVVDKAKEANNLLQKVLKNLLSKLLKADFETLVLDEAVLNFL